MNLLPWLLDWPPSPATVAVFLVLTAFSVGTLVAFGGVTDQITDENVTVAETDLSVRLNDELDIPSTNGSVETCLASGTPGDSILVVGDLTVDAPASGTGKHSPDRPLAVVLGLAHTEQTTTEQVDGTGGTTDVHWVVEDDETLAIGDEATVQIRVRSGGTTVATATRAITVEEGSRSYDC